MLQRTIGEIDRRVCWAVNGEIRARIPLYSTNARLAERLIRWLDHNGISASIENTAGAWSCVLRGGSQRIASGSGETRALAVASAVANCDFAAPPEPRSRPRRPDAARRTSGPGQRRRCPACEVELAPSKGPVRLSRLCNVCAWGRTKARSLTADNLRGHEHIVRRDLS